MNVRAKKLAGAVALLTLPLMTTLQASTHNSEQPARSSTEVAGQTTVVMDKVADKKTAPQRIVSAGNGVTELLYALGAGDQVIAVDSTSQWPPETRKLPRLGYHKQLSSEGILAMAPTLLIGTDVMGPPATISQLKSAGVHIESLPIDFTVKTMHYRIERLAKLLGKEAQGKQLWASIKQSLDEAQRLANSRKEHPKVLFLLATGGRTPSVSGSHTAANAMIELAGGTNVAASKFSSYKPLSNESLLEMAPDVIIYSDRGDGTTPEQILAMQPALKQTPAGRSGKVVGIDGTLLLGGLGPRTGETAIKLAKILYADDSSNRRTAAVNKLADAGVTNDS